MKATFAAALVFTGAVFAFLGHAWIARAKDKQIEILHAPRILFAPNDIGFLVRVKPIESDRQLTALLCDLDDPDPCTVLHHDRMSQIDFTSSLPPKLWSPKPFLGVGGGEFAIVVAVGRDDTFRATDMQRVSLIAP